LNDAIESGLVKTPRVVVRDDGVPDARTYKSHLYHIYPEVKDDLNRKADEHEQLPDLVINGYYLLGKDWLETAKSWEKFGFKTPPVMITVANRTETAARIKYTFEHKKIRIDELCVPEKTLHIDSKVLEMAEAQEEAAVVEDADTTEKEVQEEEPTYKLSKKKQAELLRQIVDTVGQLGKPGEQIQNVISVGMLSEGWDAKTVTHIMGLRAFTSQLLCEQVVGRGLRRTSYELKTGESFLEPEYVNIFGIPFTFLPHETQDGPPPPPTQPKTKIEPVIEKQQYEIMWPNIIRVDHIYKPTLELDMDKIKPLILDASKAVTLVEIAPIVEGKPDVTKIAEIELMSLGQKYRMQKIIFEAVRDVYDRMKPTWKGNKEYLLSQLIRLVEKFISSNKIQITPLLFNQDELRQRVLITLNMQRLVQHIWEAIRFENTEHLTPIFDSDYPIRSTQNMQTWYTGKPCEYTKKSHINFCVFDSTWEASESFEFDRNPNVNAWVKNDHLGFEILYIFNGVVRKYRPDFIIKLTNGSFLILETKGQETQQDKTKWKFLDEWVKAVNQHREFGKWQWAVSKNPADVAGIIEKTIHA
jgi:type III restriction enzyme